MRLPRFLISVAFDDLVVVRTIEAALSSARTFIKSTVLPLLFDELKRDF